jgi:hypothetical protein
MGRIFVTSDIRHAGRADIATRTSRMGCQGGVRVGQQHTSGRWQRQAALGMGHQDRLVRVTLRKMRSNIWIDARIGSRKRTTVRMIGPIRLEGLGHNWFGLPKTFIFYILNNKWIWGIRWVIRGTKNWGGAMAPFAPHVDPPLLLTQLSTQDGSYN